MIARILTVVTLLLVPCGLTRAAQVGPAVDVAPKAEETRSQLLASVAWCEGAKCWLVVWREGYLNEDSSDIWCARVSADGRALDPAGVRLTTGPGLKDRPVAASDGKGFLVAWQAMGDSADAKTQGWDVYGVMVSADGTPASARGFLIAGGAHNQCRPTAAFCGGGYHVAWMGFDRGYGIYGRRVSPDGRLPDSAPLELDLAQGRNVAISPVLGAHADTLRLVTSTNPIKGSEWSLWIKALDPAGGRPVGSSKAKKHVARTEPNLVRGGRTPAFAVGEKESMLAIYNNFPKCRGVMILRADPAGAFTKREKADPDLSDRQACAYDGTNYVLVADCIRQDRKRVWPKSTVNGWVVTPDGTPGSGFLVSEGSTANCLSPAAAGGPAGCVLAVYSEFRGSDDTKVVARIVR